MPRDPRYDVLFEPMEIGPKTLPNRFWQVPQCVGSTPGTPALNAVARAVKADGGWGAVNTELVSIHPSADPAPMLQPTLWDETDAHNLSLVATAIKDGGALAGIELGYNGFARSFDTRLVPLNPTQLGSEVIEGLVAYGLEATEKEIQQNARDWAKAATVARDIGFDIIYVYGSQDLGPMRFLSKFHNKRDDRYGGSLEKRARHWIEVLEAVKDAVGSDCAIAIRMALDDLRGQQGLPLQEVVRVVEWLDPLVDVFDFNIAGWDWGEDNGASRFYPENHFKEWTREAKAVVSKPVVSVGRLTSPDTMVEAIKSGQLDIIGAARPSISDPFLPNKIKEGRLEDIRECIGCNTCIGRWEARARVACTQNATVGEEFRRGWHPERFSTARNADNDVVVIGSGPAGLECAMVLGKRGMRRVHLVEQAPDIGGVLRWIPRLPRLGEWGRLLNYRQIQIDKLKNVDIIPKTALSAADALDYGAEYIVVASGASFVRDGTNFANHAPIPGADASLAHCLTPEQIMLEGKEVPGKTVAILDYDGYVAGLGLAELLTARGHAVTYITPMPHAASYTRYTGELPNVHRLLRDLGVRVLTERFVGSIEVGQVTVHGIYDSSFRRFPDAEGETRDPVGDPEMVAADAVVLVTGRRSEMGLYRGLLELEDEWAAAGVKGVYRIGDCVAPRQLSEAIFDGHRLAREIDSPDPATPLPPRREVHRWGTVIDPEVSARAYLNEVLAGTDIRLVTPA